MTVKQFKKLAKERLDNLTEHKQHSYFVSCVEMLANDINRYTDHQLNQFIAELDLVISANRRHF